MVALSTNISAPDQIDLHHHPLIEFDFEALSGGIVRIVLFHEGNIVTYVFLTCGYICWMKASKMWPAPSLLSAFSGSSRDTDGVDGRLP